MEASWVLDPEARSGIQPLCRVLSPRPVGHTRSEGFASPRCVEESRERVLESQPHSPRGQRQDCAERCPAGKHKCGGGGGVRPAAGDRAAWDQAGGEGESACLECEQLKQEAYKSGCVVTVNIYYIVIFMCMCTCIYDTIY